MISDKCRDWLIDWNIISGTLGMHMFIQSLPFSLPYHIMMHDVTIANLEESLHGKLVDPMDMYFQKTFVQKDRELFSQMKKGISDYAKNKQKPLILTGHSLGGMVAQVMATQIALESYQNVTAVVFNSPGLKYAPIFREDNT